MGKFSDAFAKGRKSAKEEKEKKRHQGDADTARRLAGVAAALTWIERFVYPAVQKRTSWWSIAMVDQPMSAPK
jgi:hypothetical protein